MELLVSVYLEDDKIDIKKLIKGLIFQINLPIINESYLNNDYFNDISTEAALFFKCEKLYLLKKDNKITNKFQLEKLFNRQEINIYEKKSYLKNNEYITFRICFFKIYRLYNNVFILRDSNLLKKINNNHHVSPFFRSVYYFNFRGKVFESADMYNSKMSYLFFSGIVIKLYLFIFRLIPNFMKNLMKFFLKFFMLNAINKIESYEKLRIENGIGLLRISKYYANRMIFLSFFKSFLSLINFFKIR
jgi:hypothetical protein